MEKYYIDTLVVGAGVVGLATARAIAAQHSGDVWLVEQHAGIGMETSSRNSEVIHAGIYYPPGSLKAETCLKGKNLLYDYCSRKSVPFLHTGKIIVASSVEDINRLQQISDNARESGVCDLEWLDSGELKKLEPELRGEVGLLSPSTGVIDSHRYMLALQQDFESAGGHLVLNSQVKLVGIGPEGIELELVGQNAGIFAKRCVNSCGLYASHWLDSVVDLKSQAPQYRFAKGSYFSYGGRVPFQHLIYPIPQDGGLGVHLTLDVAGQAKFGPDVTWLEEGVDPASIDFRVDENKKEAFLNAISAFWPKIDADRLQPDYSGVRPKLVGPGESAADFVIQTEADHGVPGLVNLLGIESPGLTASLAIAERVTYALK